MNDNVTIIEATKQPIDKNALDELIVYSGYKVDMLLQYERPEGQKNGHYIIFAKYHQGQVVRQVFTQRQTPRNFSNLQRAVDWGKRIGFATICLSIDYTKYP